MKKFALIAIAAGAATLAPQAASAQVIINNGGGFNNGFGGGNFFGGFAFGGFFHQPQFHVQNWQLYGFIQPQHHQRWVRYYDDAYLVDRRGYIFDRRERVDWDRYGERWERDDRGIPYYVGHGDYRPDGRDYDRVEHERRYSSGWDYSGYGSACGRPQPCGGPGHGGYANGGSYGHGGSYSSRGAYGQGYGAGGYGHSGYGGNGYTVRHAAPLPPSCGRPEYDCGGSGRYGYSGYGYGHGGAGTVIVTETTVTPGQVVTEEIIEEVIEERVAHRPRRRAHRAPAPRRHHAPPPRVIHHPGDRG